MCSAMSFAPHMQPEILSGVLKFFVHSSVASHAVAAASSVSRVSQGAMLECTGLKDNRASASAEIDVAAVLDGAELAFVPLHAAQHAGVEPLVDLGLHLFAERLDIGI